MQQEYLDTLAACALFAGIAAEDLPATLDCLGAAVRQYGPDAYILHQGDAATQVGVVLSGSVGVVREDNDGNRSLQAVLGEGELFAETLAAAGVGSMPLSVTALAESAVLLFPYARLAEGGAPQPANAAPQGEKAGACRHHTALQRNLLGILARKNLLLNNRLRHLSQRGIRGRVLSYLSDYSPAGGGEFTLPVDRQGMADLLCVDRSALSAELSRMQRDGLIRFHRSRFQLL